MPLEYKIDDILLELKNHGFSTYRIQKEGILSSSTIQKLRKHQSVSWSNLEAICYMLDCEISDLVKYTKSDSDISINQKSDI